MTDRALIRAEAARLRVMFEAAGATPVETEVLQPADTLLDLYGEDIRGRAYITSDLTSGEQMLRPDFTVPVVQMHMNYGAEPARYTYSGEVFRRQDNPSERASEYTQVGYEVFDRNNAEDADAEVFARLADILAPLKLRYAIGDMGVLLAAVHGLDTSDARKKALLRHIWRPRKFRALMDRFAGRVPMSDHRKALISSDDPFHGAPPQIGLRQRVEIATRITALQEDAQTPPIPEGQVTLFETLLNVCETTPFALQQLFDISIDLPAIAPAVERLSKRIDALCQRGIDPEQLKFEATYGRSSMEYYDGFVFGMYAPDRPDLPAVATGGRYDALTRVLGQGREIPAVGGVIRPDLVLELGGLV